MNSPGLFRSLFTELDNETWCPVRLFGIGFAIIASSTYLLLAIWTVVALKQPLDYVSCGTGLASVWTVVSAAVVFKAKFGDRK